MFKAEIHEQEKQNKINKQNLHPYFPSKFSEIDSRESSIGVCGGRQQRGSSNDTSRAVAYFKRCIEVHANVMANVSLPERSH